MMVNWSKIPPGKSFNLHYHEDLTEIFIMIRGSVTMKVDGESFRLAIGDTVVVSPGEKQWMKNATAGVAEYIVIGIAHRESGKTVVLK